MDLLPVLAKTVLLGLGTVFVGLILLIYLTKAMSAFCLRKKAAVILPAAEQHTPYTHGAFVAAIAAVVAESMGANVSDIRIHSIKRLEQRRNGGERNA